MKWLLLIFVIILSGCSEKKDRKWNDAPVEIKLKDNLNFIDPYQSEIFKIDQIAFIDESKIFLKSQKNLRVFDWEGEFLYEIDLEKSFEYEACNITDFTYSDDTLFLYCQQKQIIIKYDLLTGEFLSTQRSDVKFNTFHYNGKGFILYQSKNMVSDDSISYEIIVKNDNFESINYFLPFQPSNSNVQELFLGTKNLFGHNGETSFTKILNDTIIHFDNDSRLEYSTTGFEEKDSLVLQNSQLNPVLIDENTLIHPIFYSFNSKYESFNYLKGEKPVLVLRERIKDKGVKISHFSLNGQKIPPFAEIIDDKLIIKLTDEGIIQYNEGIELENEYLLKLKNYERSILFIEVPLRHIL